MQESRAGAVPEHVSTQAGEFMDFAPGIGQIFPNDFPELSCRVEASEGILPEFVRGSYYLNGPARFGIGDFRYGHWLDGDGMVSCLRFTSDGVHLTSRYVQSTKLLAEREAGKPVFRTFGTGFAGSRLNRANNGLESPANVSIYPFGQRLLAFGEQGLPWELDPKTLETRGQCTFNDRLTDASPFSAHPKFDPDSGEMFNFGIFFSPQGPKLYFYCFGAEGLRYRKAIPLEYPCSVHDFALSKNYAVFFLSPYLLDAQRITRGGLTVMESLRWEPERGSRLVIVARATGELAASIPIGKRYCLHLINAFERENTLVADVLEFDEPIYGQYQPVPNLYQEITNGGPVRFIVNLKSWEAVVRKELGYKLGPDFPSIDVDLGMRNYDDFWMLGISSTGHKGRKFFDQLVHINWDQSDRIDIYQCSPMHYLGGEPVFIKDPAGHGGVVLCQEFDARECRTSFVFFDALKVSSGPLIRFPVLQPFYLGFHAAFRPEIAE